MPQIGALKSWTTNEILTSDDLNATFAEIKDKVNTWGVFKDQANTFTQLQTFSLGAAFGAAVTITTGGLTVTAGGITITAGGVTITAGGLVIAAGGAGIAGNVAVAGNITCTGTITAAGISGPTTVPATNVTAGTFPAGAFAFTNNLTVGGAVTATSFSGAGSALTSLNASNIASGTLDAARLPASITAVTITTLTSDTINGAVATITKGSGASHFLTTSSPVPWVTAGGVGAIAGDNPDVLLAVNLGGVAYVIPCYVP